MLTKTVLTALLFFCWQALALAAMVYLTTPWAIVVPVALSVAFGGLILWYWRHSYRLLYADADDRVRDVMRQLDAVRLANATDPMTGLRTRRHIQERLDESLAIALDRDHQCAVLLLDLDFFKDINQALGHQLGNRLLVAIAARLDSVVKKGDLLGYYGGDEFIILLPKIDDSAAAELVARRCLGALNEPFEVGGHLLAVSASIGICTGPRDGSESESLIRHAESALAQCKAQGRNGYRFYTRALDRSAVERLKIDQQLRGALERDEFYLEYQPIVAARDHALVGAEALIRWRNPELGLVSPADCITTAEQIGLIADIGNWVLHESATQILAWQALTPRPLLMSVNVSPRQFHDGSIVSQVRKTVSQLGLDAHLLQLEVTEGVVMNASNRLIEDLTTLKGSGVLLALDDFGTGYSSLSYLMRMPFDTLKIDRSFIGDIPRSAQQEALTEAMVRMGHSLDMKIVAEGVETLEQADCLSRLRVDRLQGFYFSQALGPRDFERRYFHCPTGTQAGDDAPIRGRLP